MSIERDQKCLQASGLVDPIHFCMPVLLKIMGTVKGHGHGIGGKDIPVMAHLAKARRWSKGRQTCLSSPDLTAIHNE